MPILEDFLLGWRREVLNKDAQAALSIVWRLRNSRLIRAGLVSMMAIALADAALSADHTVRHINLMSVAAICLGFSGMHVFAARGGQCDSALTCFVAVARHLEQRSDPATQMVFNVTVRRLRRVSAFTQFALAAHILIAMVRVREAYKSSPLAAVLGPAGGIGFQVAHCVFRLIQVPSGIFGLLAYYRMLALASALTGVDGALFRGLYIRTASARGPQLRELAALHCVLLKGTRFMRQGLEGAVCVVVVGSIVLHLTGTVQLALAFRHDPAAPWTKAMFMLLRSSIMGFLGLLCFMCDDLEKDSQSLTLGLYEGPWPEEDPSQRLIRVGFMQGSRTGAFLSLKGMGRLNRPLFRVVIEKWFSFLQVLIKMDRGPA